MEFKIINWRFIKGKMKKILIIVKIYHWSLNTQKVLWSDLAEEAQISEMWTNQYIEEATSDFFFFLILNNMWLYLTGKILKRRFDKDCN